MPVDPNAAIQIQIARDQAAAAWNAALAAWLAGGATFLAVIAAFVVQRFQAASDKGLQAVAKAQLAENVRLAVVWAVEFIEALHLETESKQLSMRPEERLETARRLLSVLDYYQARDLPSADIIAATFAIRPLLHATTADLDGWRMHMHAQQGVSPDEVRNRLRNRIERMKVALREVDPDDQLLRLRKPEADAGPPETPLGRVTH